MLRIFPAWLVSILAAMAVCASTRAADQSRLTKLKTVLVPKKLSSPHIRESECVQNTPELRLWNGDKKVTPSTAGFVYVVEQNDGNRLLLSDLNEGVRGWAAPGAMVPLNQAEAYFSGGIKANSRNAFAYLMRGVARFENDDLDHAAADLDAALKLEPKCVAALVARAQLWQWRNQLDRAMADASQAIELDPRNSYAYVERGIFLYNVKKHDKALADFDQATELGSRAAVIHIARGMIHIDKTEFAKAQAEFRKAIELDPKHPDAYSGYASLFLIRGNSKTAISILDQAIDADPQSPESHGNRAIVFLSIGKYDKALDDLNEVIRFAPNSARALRERAWLLATCPDAKFRKPEEAVTTATRVCDLTEWNEPQALTTLAAACSETGDFTAAVKWQTKAIELLAGKSPEKQDYRKLLDRYKASKPYHRLGLLEESGIQIPRIAAKKD